MDWQTFSAQWGFNYAFWVAMTIAVVSILITFWMRSRSRLAFDRRSSTIVSQNETPFSKMIKITFDGKEIPRGTVSTLTVWNDGNKTIRRADITPKKPLAVTVPNGEQILQINISSMADEAMDVFAVLATENAANISFEYIEPKNGFVCEVFHTGNSNDITLEGILIEAGTPRSKAIPTKSTRLQTAWNSLVTVTVTPFFGYKIFTDLSENPFNWGQVILATLFSLVTIAAAYMTVVNVSSHLASAQLKLGSPRDLEQLTSDQ